MLRGGGFVSYYLVVVKFYAGRLHGGASAGMFSQNWPPIIQTLWSGEDFACCPHAAVSALVVFVTKENGLTYAYESLEH